MGRGGKNLKMRGRSGEVGEEMEKLKETTPDLDGVGGVRRRV